MGRDVDVVLISWNSARWLPASLASLRAQSLSGGAIRLIAIDNASIDRSLALLESERPAVVIRNETNRGFAAAANQGIAAGSAPYVLFLNPDVRMERGFIDGLVAGLERAGESWGAATGTLYRGEGPEIRPLPTLDSRGVRMTRNGRHLDITDPPPARDSGAQEVFGVSGAAALYRRSCLTDLAIGGEIFDESFFAYREDADLAWRARLFGWRALWVPEAIGWHVRRVTPENRREAPEEINFHSVKNRFLLRMKNEGGALLRRNAPFTLSRDALVLGAALTIERSSLPAFRWLWDHRAEIMRKRREIQGRRRVADRELMGWFT